MGTAVRLLGWESRTDTASTVQRLGDGGDDGRRSWSFQPSPLWLPELATPLVAPLTAQSPSAAVREVAFDFGYGGGSGAVRRHCPETSGTAPMQLDSTKKKRAKKMKKHQLKKRRKRDRAKNRAK
jgi:hypothetical protein